jgi:hypothetical protein
MKPKDLMNFVESLSDRGLLTKSPEEFDYEQVIWEYMKQRHQPVKVTTKVCSCGSGETNFHKDIGCRECC